MAFQQSRFVRSTIGFNAGQITTTFNPDPASVVEGGPTIFTYGSAVDTVATIGAGTYFLPVLLDLHLNDLIYVVGSDSSIFYTVSAIDYDAMTYTLASAFPTGSVGTANIQNLAVTTAKIADANVTLGKLASGIAPSHVVKFGGASVQAGGSATVTITVTGMLNTDLPFCQIGASTNAVNVQKVTATANTITVLCSGDPGASTFNYQVLRAAS
jgi:hypothetical protein